MAVINEDAFKSRIKSGSLAPVYIIFGDDGYLKKMYVEKLTKMTADKDDIFNFCRFGGDCDLHIYLMNLVSAFISATMISFYRHLKT